jgi:hypothetical protein
VLKQQLFTGGIREPTAEGIRERCQEHVGTGGQMRFISILVLKVMVKKLQTVPFEKRLSRTWMRKGKMRT